MIRSILPSEHQIQCAIVEWSTKVFVDHPNGGKVLLRPYLIKITNEGKRSWAQGKKMKAEGLTKGVSDLFLAFPIYRFLDECKGGCCGTNEEYAGFWLEIKKKGKKPTHDQLAFLAEMREVGYHSDFKDGVDEGIQAIKNYLGIK